MSLPGNRCCRTRSKRLTTATEIPMIHATVSLPSRWHAGSVDCSSRSLTGGSCSFMVNIASRPEIAKAPTARPMRLASSARPLHAARLDRDQAQLADDLLAMQGSIPHRAHKFVNSDVVGRYQCVILASCSDGPPIPGIGWIHPATRYVQKLPGRRNEAAAYTEWFAPRCKRRFS
jgi:hypothetical protein